MLRFNVRPVRKSRLSVIVEVYDTRRELLSTLKRDDTAQGEQNNYGGLSAVTCGIDVRNERGRLLPQFALVRFCREHIGSNTVSHECFHVAMRYIERLGLTINWNDSRALRNTRLQRDRTRRLSVEERAAIFHGNLAGRIVDEFYTRGVYGKTPSKRKAS